MRSNEVLRVTKKYNVSAWNNGLKENVLTFTCVSFGFSNTASPCSSLMDDEAQYVGYHLRYSSSHSVASVGN